MKLFGAICGLLAILFAFFALRTSYKWAVQRIFDRGFKVGYDAGHKQGKLEESNWWLTVEKSIENARRQIWRQETIRGEEAGWP